MDLRVVYMEGRGVVVVVCDGLTVEGRRGNYRDDSEFLTQHT